MKTTPLAVAVLLALLALPGCAQKVVVMIPPDRDLTAYERIGMITFSGPDASLNAIATRRFQQAVLDAQGGVQLIEMGEARALARSVGRDRLDAEALSLIAAHNDLDAMFFGELEVSKVTPKIKLSTSILDFRGRADVEGALSVRLATDGGATVWSNSCRDTVSVAHASVDSDGGTNIGVGDAPAAQRGLAEALAARMTGDFQAHYVRRTLEQVPPGYEPTWEDGTEVYAPPARSRRVAGADE